MPGANNPLNIRYNPSEEWEGQIGQTGGFADFETLRHGIRAGDINLQNYGKLHGINTLEGVINRWAPPSDNNPTQNYVDFVSSRTGIIPTQRLDLNDPRLRADILSAMADFENEGNNNVAADAIRQSRISVPIAVAGLDRPSGASEAARRIERGEQERYGAEAEQRGRDVAQFIREDEQLGILGAVVRGAGNVVGDAWTTYMSEPAGEIGGAVQARWRDTMDNLRSRDRERLFEPNPERDRLMVAGMFPELEGLEEGSIPEELLRPDAGNIAAIAAEDEIFSVGDRLGEDYGKDLPLGGTGDAQLADALLKRTPSALETDLARRQQEYLTESEALTAENVEAEESIVADYRDRIERSQQQARDDAFNAWLGHFGAGVAGGDLQGGLERGAGAIGDIKKESRATTLALEEGIVASERARRKTAVDALKSMADIDVNFLKLANEVSRETGLMDRSEDDKQIALMNLIGDLMPDTTISEPDEIETNLITMFNAVAHLFGLAQVSATGGSGGGVGAPPDIAGLSDSKYRM